MRLREFLILVCVCSSLRCESPCKVENVSGICQLNRALILQSCRLVGLLGTIVLSGNGLFAGEPMRLTFDGHVKRDPVFLGPNTREILFTVLDRPNRLRLMKLTIETGKVEAIHPDETRSEFEPAVSSDGRYLAFVQSRGNLSLALVVQDLVTNKQTEVPPGGGFSGVHSPVFLNGLNTKAATRVLYSYPEQQRQSIFSVDLECKDRRTLIDSVGVNNWPHGAVDGSRIVFASSRDDDFEIYSANADGTNIARLTLSPRQDIRPRLSPDGRRISFTSARDGNYEIYMMDVSGNQVRRMTNHPEQDDYATWSPDGTHLVFVAERLGQFDLYSLSAD